MLTLPLLWRTSTAGSTARTLVEQVEPHLQPAVWAQLVAASLALAIDGCLRRSGEHWRLIEEGGSRWRINDAVFLFFPRADDAVLQKCRESASGREEWTILVPSKSSSALAAALQQLRPSRPPVVRPVETFIAMRVLFSSADLGIGRDVSFIELLRHYNRRVSESAMAAGMRVDLNSATPRPN